MMSTPRIDDFLITERTEDKIAARSLRERQIRQVLDDPDHVIVPNRRRRAAQ